MILASKLKMKDLDDQKCLFNLYSDSMEYDEIDKTLFGSIVKCDIDARKIFMLALFYQEIQRYTKDYQKESMMK
jgi:hypothetical protein